MSFTARLFHRSISKRLCYIRRDFPSLKLQLKSDLGDRRYHKVNSSIYSITKVAVSDSSRMRLPYLSISVACAHTFAYPPTDFDVRRCSPFYTAPSAPSIADCYRALSLLPKGSEPMPWYPRPGQGENVLPLNVKYGQSERLPHSGMFPNYL